MEVPTDDSAAAVEHLCAWVFEGLGQDVEANRNLLMERAVLTPLNKTVDEVNDLMASKLPGDAREYLSVNWTNNDLHASLHNAELLERLHPAGLPPHRPSAHMLLCRPLRPAGRLALHPHVQHQASRSLLITEPSDYRQPRMHSHDIDCGYCCLCGSQTCQHGLACFPVVLFAHVLTLPSCIPSRLHL